MLNTYDEMIEVIQALSDGKELECYDTKEKVWYDIHPQIPNFNFFRYRVKPNPKVVYLVKTSLGVTTLTSCLVKGDAILEKYVQVPLE